MSCVGSNPTASAISIFHCSSMVEPPAVNRLVAGSSPAGGAIRQVRSMVRIEDCRSSDTGSTPVLVANAAVAQLVEQLICNQQVVGSSPIGGSIITLSGGYVMALVSEAEYKKEKELAKKEKERILKEKLKMASYCPKVSGCSWGYTKRKEN